jgi:hypothetical protein
VQIGRNASNQLLTPENLAKLDETWLAALAMIPKLLAPPALPGDSAKVIEGSCVPLAEVDGGGGGGK